MVFSGKEGIQWKLALFIRSQQLVLFFQSRSKYEISVRSLQLRVNRADKNNRGTGTDVRFLHLGFTFWTRVLAPNTVCSIYGTRWIKQGCETMSIAICSVEISTNSWISLTSRGGQGSVSRVKDGFYIVFQYFCTSEHNKSYKLIGQI